MIKSSHLKILSTAAKSSHAALSPITADAVSLDDIAKIYELEHKMLLSRGPDPELDDVLSRVMASISSKFAAWAVAHENGGFYTTITKSAEHQIKHLLNTPDYYQIDKESKRSLESLVRFEKSLRNISKAANRARDLPKTLKEKLILFHKILNIAHVNNKVIAHLYATNAFKRYKISSRADTLKINIDPIIEQEKAEEKAQLQQTVEREIDAGFDRLVDMRDKDKIPLKHIIRFFLMKHYKRDIYKHDIYGMLMRLLDAAPSKFFDMGLYNHEQLAVMTEMAAVRTAYLEPSYFLKYVLPNFPLAEKYHDLATNQLKTTEARFTSGLTDIMNKGIVVTAIKESGKLDLIKRFPQYEEYIKTLPENITAGGAMWAIKNFDKMEAKSRQTFLRVVDKAIEFEQYKQYFEQKDINKYSYQDLVEKIPLAKERDFKKQQVRERKKTRKKRRGKEQFGDRKIAEKYTDKIYEDDEFLVISPSTPQAAIYYGQRTKWCVASTKNNMFSSYATRQSNLYYIIDKKVHSSSSIKKICVQATSGDEYFVSQPTIEEVKNALDIDYYIPSEAITVAILNDMGQHKDPTRYEYVLANDNKDVVIDCIKRSPSYDAAKYALDNNPRKEVKETVVLSVKDMYSALAVENIEYIDNENDKDEVRELFFYSNYSSSRGHFLLARYEARGAIHAPEYYLSKPYALDKFLEARNISGVIESKLLNNASDKQIHTFAELVIGQNSQQYPHMLGNLNRTTRKKVVDSIIRVLQLSGNYWQIQNMIEYVIGFKESMEDSKSQYRNLISGLDEKETLNFIEHIQKIYDAVGRIGTMEPNNIINLLKDITNALRRYRRWGDRYEEDESIESKLYFLVNKALIAVAHHYPELLKTPAIKAITEEFVGNELQNIIHNIARETEELRMQEEMESASRFSKREISLSKRAALYRNANSLKPIAPMKLKKTTDPKSILDDYKEEDIWVQQKIDGIKVMAIKDSKGSIKIYSRRGEDFTSNVDPLVKDLENKLNSGDFILGELAWVKNGKQSISDIQTILGSTPENAKKKLQEKGQMIFYVYDFLWNNGHDITKNPYKERYEKLKKQIGSGTQYIKLVKNYSWGELDKAVKDALNAGGEGAVIKYKGGSYNCAPKGSSEKTGEQWKFKPGAKAKEVDLIVKDYKTGEGGKIIMPAYEYHNKKLREVGQISGLSKEEEKEIKKLLDQKKMVVIEVGYQEQNPKTHKLRHPSFHRLRKDKSPESLKND